MKLFNKIDVSIINNPFLALIYLLLYIFILLLSTKAYCYWYFPFEKVAVQNHWGGMTYDTEELSLKQWEYFEICQREAEELTKILYLAETPTSQPYKTSQEL